MEYYYNMFWKKKKKDTIVVNAYTDRKDQYDAYQPMLARKFLPDWWKKLPQHRETDMPGYDTMPVATLKTCPAINGILKEGIIFPAWCELHAKVDAGGNRFFHAVPDYIQMVEHDRRDFEHHKPGLAHIKITSPWTLVEETGVQWVWMKPDWHHDNPLSYWTVPGLIEYKYQHACLNNIFIPHDTQLTIPAGLPWLQLVPMSDKPVEIHCHLISSEKQNQLNSGVAHSTSGGYLKRIVAIRKQKERLNEDN